MQMQACPMWLGQDYSPQIACDVSKNIVDMFEAKIYDLAKTLVQQSHGFKFMEGGTSRDGPSMVELLLCVVGQ